MKEKYLWPLPESSYLHEGKSGVHMEHSGIKESIDLESPATQDQLFRTFRQIRNPETCIRWMQKYGCPWEPVGLFTYYNPHDVLNLSRCVSWIWYFSQLLKHSQVDFVRNHLRFQSRADKYAANLTEDEWHEIVERVESKNFANSSDLVNYFALTRASEHLECGSILFSRYETFETEIMQIDSLFGTSPLPLNVGANAVAIEIKNIANKSDDLTVLHWGHQYLQKAVTAMLVSVQPSIQIVPPNTMGGFSFEINQVLSVQSPWQAIVSELVKRITSQSIARTCANNSCGATFIPSRADNIFCARPGCRKAASRQRKKFLN